MSINEVEISFKVDIEATSHEKIEQVVQSIVEKLDLGNHEWRLTFVSQPLTRLESN